MSAEEEQFQNLFILRKKSSKLIYTIRNKIRNKLWPMQGRYFLVIYVISLIFILGKPEYFEKQTNWIWATFTHLSIFKDLPKWFLGGIIISPSISAIIFLILLEARIAILKFLLGYHGWLYSENRIKNLFWGILIKLFFRSEPVPSLYACSKVIPKLPLPSLSSTLDKLIEAYKPFKNEEELKEMRKEALEFKKNVGWKLQLILWIKSWWAENYVTDWWEKYIYLSSRDSVVLASNYYGINHSYWAPTNIQSARAGTVIHLVMAQKRLIDREDFSPNIAQKTIPLCMKQYKRLFATTRVPGLEIDQIVSYDTNKSKHVVINYKGIWHKINCFSSLNELLSPTELTKQIEGIMSQIDSELDQLSYEERSLSSLTSLPRTQWATIYQKYFNKGINRVSLDVIEQSAFAVVLSEEASTDLTAKSNEALFGGGNLFWHDKAASVIIYKSAHSGMQIEHTTTDGMCVANVWEEALIKEMVEKWYDPGTGKCFPRVLPDGNKGKRASPERLIWEIDSDLGKECKNARKKFETEFKDVDLQVHDFNAWGKGFIKKCKVSPDAFIQATLQLAYFKDSGRFVNTYEPTITRFFGNGRTETVRSCTFETAEFVKAMMDKNQTKEERKAKLLKAFSRHSKVFKDSMCGRGIDRHLFALYVASKGFKYEVPFLEKIIKDSWIISTTGQSHKIENIPDLNHPAMQNMISCGGGFVTISAEGYGIAYMFGADLKFFFHVSSRKSCPKTDTKRMINNICSSLEDIKQLFC